MSQKKYYIGKTPNRGKGLFAAHRIAKGEVVFIAKGKIISSYYCKQFHIGPRWIGIGRAKWLSPFRNNALWYLNHSCSPNTGRKGMRTMVAMKTIQKDEEITLDYSTTEEDPHWRMRCHCLQKNCRGTIRAIQFLPKKLFKKYRNYLSPFLLRAYSKAHD
jgi:SET domain-containing protein